MLLLLAGRAALLLAKTLPSFTEGAGSGENPPGSSGEKVREKRSGEDSGSGEYEALSQLGHDEPASG